VDIQHLPERSGEDHDVDVFRTRESRRQDIHGAPWIGIRENNDPSVPHGSRGLGRGRGR
jgi:hypothetical protein